MENILIKNVASYLRITENDVLKIIKYAPFRYKKYNVMKKNGQGFRRILHPAKEVKMLQYAFMQIIFSKMPIHDSAMAYIKGKKSPLRLNAEYHAGYNYTSKYDFIDFFPSIKCEDLFTKLIDNDFIVQDEDILIFRNVCFYPYQDGWGLPIGAPSSPIISNLVMYDLDKSIELISKEIDINSKYTRYADDIAFSSNNAEYILLYYEQLSNLLNSTNSPKLKLNEAKTFVMSRASRRKITGLILTSDKKVSIGRKKKRYIRKLCFEYIGSANKFEQVDYLRGLLAFVMDVEPDFFDRLVIKYGNALVDLIKKVPNVKRNE